MYPDTRVSTPPLTRSSPPPCNPSITAAPPTSETREGTRLRREERLDPEPPPRPTPRRRFASTQRRLLRRQRSLLRPRGVPGPAPLRQRQARPQIGRAPSSVADAISVSRRRVRGPRKPPDRLQAQPRPRRIHVRGQGPAKDRSLLARRETHRRVRERRTEDDALASITRLVEYSRRFKSRDPPPTSSLEA